MNKLKKDGAVLSPINFALKELFRFKGIATGFLCARSRTVTYLNFAGSANIGKRYAMFEAIHGSAPRMVTEGRDKYADPCSIIRAGVMLLSHIGYQAQADKLEKALDRCMYEEKKLVITGREDGATCTQFADYIMQTLTAMS